MTIGPKGGNAALVVVDMQVGVLVNAWDTTRIANNVALAVSRARAEGVPVIWVQHSDEELQQNSTLWQLVPELEPAEGEARVNKHFNSSFEQTELEALLNGLVFRTWYWPGLPPTGASAQPPTLRWNEDTT